MSLSYLVFLGSVRTEGPPSPQRLGERVARAVQTQLVAQGHTSRLIDPLSIAPAPNFRPHFAYAKGRAPDDLEELSQRIAKADGYVMVSPEYNHSMSPALADLLNHFAASLFGHKPSAIATYSAGQWGGTRAAVGMRTYLSELGCLPVSAMIHVPKAQEVFDADGGYLDGVDGDRWSGYLGRTLDQLTWWAEAAKAQRAAVGEASAPFTKSPSERNAPAS